MSPITARTEAALDQGRRQPLSNLTGIAIQSSGRGFEQDRTSRTFVRDAFAAMETPEIHRAVLDLRRDDDSNRLMVEGLRRRLERSRFNRPGGLYVPTSGMTFSAAQNVTSRIERETCAIFVGEPSGGAPSPGSAPIPWINASGPTPVRGLSGWRGRSDGGRVRPCRQPNI